MVRKNHCNSYFSPLDEDLGHDSFGLIFGGNSHVKKRGKPKLFYLVYFTLASMLLGFVPVFFFFTTGFSFLRSQKPSGSGSDTESSNHGLCFSVSNGTLCCDRTSVRSDICVMKGDVRADPSSSSAILYASHGHKKTEKIRPYTRKWETDVMNRVTELDLMVEPNTGTDRRCDVRHRVPAIFFSTGGYTGNLYHEFNDGILPLYITSQHMNKKVIFVILDYHHWWITKYGDLLTQLSDFPVIDFSRDRTMIHCFAEAIFGLRIHGELTIDPSLLVNNKSMLDFHGLLDRAYAPRIRTLETDGSKPKLVIISRNGSRAITNQEALIETARDIGFSVEVLTPKRTTELAKIYGIVNSSHVVIGVHGAALTHLTFMKPRSVLIQVIPLGTDWAADAYYGEPARKFGLKYIPYKVVPKESSLYYKYDKSDPILTDPSSINSKGWEFTKKIYLDHQTVRLKLPRFRKRLVRAYDYCRRLQEGRSLS